MDFLAFVFPALDRITSKTDYLPVVSVKNVQIPVLIYLQFKGSCNGLYDNRKTTRGHNSI